MHTGKGLQLVNTEKLRSYDLALNTKLNFNVSRSLSLRLLEDGEQGVLMAQIDNGQCNQMLVKVYLFDAEYIKNLN